METINARQFYKKFEGMKFCRIYPRAKNPIGDDWQNKPYDYKDVVNEKDVNGYLLNFGVLTGFGNYIIIDIDDECIIDELQTLIDCDTFTVRSGSGNGYHLYFKVSNPENIDKNKYILYKDNKHVGEILWKTFQAVCAGSLHPNGKYYEIINDCDIKNITAEKVIKIGELFKKPIDKPSSEVFDGLGPQKRSSSILNSIIDNKKIQEQLAGLNNIEKNNVLFKNLAIQYYYGSEEIKSKIHDFIYICGHNTSEFDGWVKKAPGMSINDGELNNWIENYDLKGIFGNVDNYSGLKLYSESDVLAFTEKNEHIVKNLIYSRTLNMIYAPPASFKSLFTLYLAMKIASGGFMFGKEVKQENVLYLDKENPKFTYKNRYNGLLKGTGLVTKNKLFTYMNGDIKDEGFLLSLKTTIRERKIGVIIFDTLHRFGSYNEDKADDLNQIYVDVFQPLINDFGCTIIFLHHTTKVNKEDLKSYSKKSYRGSSDFEGMCDTIIKIDRGDNNDRRDTKFKLVVDKNRHGRESADINIEAMIDSDDDDNILSADFVMFESDVEMTTKDIIMSKVVALFTTPDKILSSKDIKQQIRLSSKEMSTFKQVMNKLETEKVLEKISGDKGKVATYQLGSSRRISKI